MRYVVASSSERTLDPWVKGLSGIPGIDFRLGSLPQVGEGCGAQIAHFTSAHDRYGGIPQIGKAQALLNRFEDGAPRVILATPPLPLKDLQPEGNGVELSDKAIEEHVFRTIRLCIEEADRLNREGSVESIRCILIHLVGLGFDRFKSEPALKGFRRAIMAENP